MKKTMDSEPQKKTEAQRIDALEKRLKKLEEENQKCHQVLNQKIDGALTKIQDLRSQISTRLDSLGESINNIQMTLGMVYHPHHSRKKQERKSPIKKRLQRSPQKKFGRSQNKSQRESPIETIKFIKINFEKTTLQEIQKKHRIYRRPFGTRVFGLRKFE